MRGQLTANFRNHVVSPDSGKRSTLDHEAKTKTKRPRVDSPDEPCRGIIRAKGFCEEDVADAIGAGRGDKFANQVGDYLAFAVRRDDIAMLNEMLESGVDVNSANRAPSYPTALHFAGLFGRPKTASLLVEHGADLKFMPKNAMSPMEAAAHHGGKEALNVVQLLLSRGADPFTHRGYRGGLLLDKLRLSSIPGTLHEETALFVEEYAKRDVEQWNQYLSSCCSPSP